MKNNNIKIAKYKDLLPINTLENQEIMVNISKKLKGVICLYEKKDMQKYLDDDIWVRYSVFKKLKKISIKLKKINKNYQLKIVYGYRHINVQKKYFNIRKKILTKKYPNISKERLNELTHALVAHPIIAGHPTGGALDLTVILNGEDLDMGTKIADFKNKNKINTFYKNLTKEQVKNRKLLHDLMLSENFAPFYGEWWHFSYGDKEWAWFYNKKNAIYNQINFHTKKQR